MSSLAHLSVTSNAVRISRRCGKGAMAWEVHNDPNLLVSLGNISGKMRAGQDWIEYYLDYTMVTFGTKFWKVWMVNDPDDFEIHKVICKSRSSSLLQPTKAATREAAIKRAASMRTEARKRVERLTAELMHRQKRLQEIEISLSKSESSDHLKVATSQLGHPETAALEAERDAILEEMQHVDAMSRDDVEGERQKLQEMKSQAALLAEEERELVTRLEYVRQHQNELEVAVASSSAQISSMQEEFGNHTMTLGRRLAGVEQQLAAKPPTGQLRNIRCGQVEASMRAEAGELRSVVLAIQQDLEIAGQGVIATAARASGQRST